MEERPRAECPICWTPFDNETLPPFNGTCGHSVCSVCIPNLVEQTCPTCRMKEAFKNPVKNFLAIDISDHLSSTEKSLNRRGNVIVDLQKRMESMEKDGWEYVSGNKKLEGENQQLKANSEELAAKLATFEELKSQLEDQLTERKSENDRLREQLQEQKSENDRLREQLQEQKSENDRLGEQLQEKEKRDLEYERLKKKLEEQKIEEEQKEKAQEEEWCLIEGRNDKPFHKEIDSENFPLPQNAVMVLPPMKIIPDDLKKQLAALGCILIHKADHTSRQFLAASKKQINETVVPMVSNLAKKAGEMVIQAQERGITHTR